MFLLGVDNLREFQPPLAFGLEIYFHPALTNRDSAVNKNSILFRVILPEVSMRFRFCTSLTFITMASLLWITAGAQERRGTIIGHVADASRGILQGARVQLQPTGQTTATDSQGQFTVSGLTPGKYTVNVSYVGFAPYSTEVTVNAGEVAKLDA